MTMSKTVKLAQHLEQLHINNMYKNDFYWTWDKTDEELEAIFTVADALRDLRERNRSTRIFDSGLGISIFRDNSTRTRFSFARTWTRRSLRLPTAKLSERPPIWSPLWQRSSVSGMTCTSVRAISIKRLLWML